MSHVVVIQTEIRNAAAVRAACKRLKLPEPHSGAFTLFSGETTGLGVELPGWRYPLVCNIDTGSISFDNYNGHWGDRRHLDAFVQAYAVERTRIEARKRGHSVTEQPLPDGSIKLVVSVAGGA